MLTKRVEILFDPERYSLLEQIARARNTSVGALIRQAVEKQLLGPTVEEKKAAVRRLVSQNIDFGSWDEVKASIEREVLRGFETAGH